MRAIRFQGAARCNLKLELHGARDAAALEPLRNRRNRLFQRPGEFGAIFGLKMLLDLVGCHLPNRFTGFRRKMQAPHLSTLRHPVSEAIYREEMADTVGNRIRRLRKAAGLKQGELAKEAKIPQSTLSDIENGRTSVPGGKISIQLARALRVQPGALLSEDGGEDMPAHAPEVSELIGLLSRLNPANRAALLAAAKAMADNQGDSTRPPSGDYLPPPRRHS